MRIAEVAVISPPGNAKELFIQAICSKLEEVNDKICFGRLEINHDLVLHLYGISVDKDESSISWDLLSPKLLGFIFIFEWDDHTTLESISGVLDYISNSCSAPIIVIANVDDNSNIPLPDKFYLPGGLSLDRDARFLFCKVSDPACAKKAVTDIVDILLDKLP